VGPITVYTCGNAPKCNNAIAADQLNAVQLKAIRLWPKTCDDCGKQTKWVEQQTLFDLLPATKPKARIGGRRNAKNTNGTSHIH
jgi:hypothetical protein